MPPNLDRDLLDVSVAMVKDVTGLGDSDQVFVTHTPTRMGSNEIPTFINSPVINVPVISVPITAVSPKEQRDMIIGEGSNNPPRILQCHKDNASCPLLLEIRKDNSRDVNGLRILEPTRQEKKKLLQYATKQRRKQRELTQNKDKAGCSKTESQPKAQVDPGIIVHRKT